MAKLSILDHTGLNNFLENLKKTFSKIGHTHTISDITDYSVDASLSSTSTKPVQNKVVKSALDAKVSTTRTINGKPLTDNISLTASDIGADSSGAANNAVSAHNTSDTAHDDIRNLINDLYVKIPDSDSLVKKYDDLEDKPFYEEGELVEVLPEMSFTIDNGYTYLMSDELDISIGEQYTVVWGGIEYVCTAKERSVAAKDGTITTSTLGNYGLSSASLEDNTGEPFLIVTTSTDIDESGSHTGILVYAASSVYTYTVAVFKGVHTIHSIAGKYIDNDTLKDTPLWWAYSEKTCLVKEMTVTLGTTLIEQLTTTTINNQDLLTIYYDGIRYECTAMSLGYYILCGYLNEFADENSDFAGVGMDMPFVIVIAPQGAMIVSAENSNLQEDHTISIYAYQHKYRLPRDYTHYYVDELPEGRKGDFSPLLSADSAGVITHIGTGGRALTCCSSLSEKTMIAYVKDNAYRIKVYVGDGVSNEMIVPAFEMDDDCNVKTGKYVKIRYYNDDYGIISLTSDDPIQAVTDKVGRCLFVTLKVADWAGNTAPYSQTVTVAGMTEADNPILVSALDDGATEATQKAYIKAFGIVTSGTATTAENSVTFKVYKKPATDIVVGLKGV